MSKRKPAQALGSRTVAVIERRRSGAHGTHDTRPRGQRTRQGAKVAAIREQSDSNN